MRLHVEAGVHLALHTPFKLLKEEIDRDMALLGVNKIDELGLETFKKY